MPSDLKIGDTIKAGTLVLITSGEYSSFGVDGIFRADVDIVVPSRKATERLAASGRDLEIDTAMLSTMMVELDYSEAWS